MPLTRSDYYSGTVVILVTQSLPYSSRKHSNLGNFPFSNRAKSRVHCRIRFLFFYVGTSGLHKYRFYPHSYTLLYKRKRLAAQPLQFLHLCGGNAFDRVGKARDLVDVVCDPGYLTDEPELFFRWPRLYFHAHDEIADDFAFSQPTLLTYFFEM